MYQYTIARNIKPIYSFQRCFFIARLKHHIQTDGGSHMIQKISAYSLVTLTVLLSACQTMIEQPSLSVSEQGIKSTIKQYQNAVNNSNIDLLIATYTQNAIQIAPNEPAINGATAIRNRAESNHAVYAYDLTSNIEDMQVSGKLATLRATFSETMASRSDQNDKTTTSGTWVLLFRQQEDSSWRIFTEIWNDEKPLN